MIYFLSMELLMPKPKKKQLFYDKRTLLALAGEPRGNWLTCRGTYGTQE